LIPAPKRPPPSGSTNPVVRPALLGKSLSRCLLMPSHPLLYCSFKLVRKYGSKWIALSHHSSTRKNSRQSPQQNTTVLIKYCAGFLLNTEVLRLLEILAEFHHGCIEMIAAFGHDIDMFHAVCKPIYVPFSLN